MDDPEKKDDALRRDSDIVAVSDGYTVEEEKAVLRKIDMVILPFVSFYLPSRTFWVATHYQHFRCASYSSYNILTSRA